MKDQNNKKKKIIRRITDIVGYLAIFLIASLLAFVLISKASGHTVFIFGKTTAWVMTPSMEPEIPARSYILVKKAPPSEIEAGDVIIFESDDPTLNSAFNTHRVVRVVGDHTEFITKGDANDAEDAYTAKADKVLGVYVKNLPVLTAIGRFLFSEIGLLIAVTAIFGIVLAMYMPGLIRATRKKAKEAEALRNEQIELRVREEVERMKASGLAAGEPPDDPVPDGEEADEEKTDDITADSDQS